MSLNIEKLSFRNPTEINSNLDAIIERLRVNQKLFNVVIDVLKRFDSKRINKRIETALKAHSELSKYRVVYYAQYSMYEVKIWGSDIPYDHMFSILLGYQGQNNDLVNVEWIINNNARYTSIDKRVDELESFIPVVDEICDEWNGAVRLLENVEAKIKRYGMEYIF